MNAFQTSKLILDDVRSSESCANFYTETTDKLAKFTTRPGKVHFEALFLFHLLRFLRDNAFFGIQFYSNPLESQLTKMLIAENVEQNHPFLGFSDSSWNDDMDTG
jgi:hypothetical protein